MGDDAEIIRCNRVLRLRWFSSRTFLEIVSRYTFQQSSLSPVNISYSKSIYPTKLNVYYFWQKSQ